MATQTTEISYPPIDSQATYTFIDSQVPGNQQVGDIQTDFKQALANYLSLTVHDYSLDDLWHRYRLAAVAADSNASAGGPLKRGKRGGQHPGHDYPPGILRNPNNIYGFPSAVALNVFDSDWAAPGDFTYAGTYSSTGLIGNTPLGDLGVMLTDQTFPRLSCMCLGFGSSADPADVYDGTGTSGEVKLSCFVVGNTSDDDASTYVLQSAIPRGSFDGDVSLTAHKWTSSGELNPEDIQFVADGTKTFIQAATDTIRVFDNVATWAADVNTPESQEAKNGGVFGFTGSQDGPAYMTNSGEYVIWAGAVGTTPTFRIANLTTPYNLDTAVLHSSKSAQASSPDLRGFNTQSGICMSEDGTQVYISVGSKLYHGIMSTAFDINTVVWSNSPLDASISTGGIGATQEPTKFWMVPNNTQIWMYSTGTGAPQIHVFTR